MRAVVWIILEYLENINSEIQANERVTETHDDIGFGKN